jgi:hypothetical protein
MAMVFSGWVSDLRGKDSKTTDNCRVKMNYAYGRLHDSLPSDLLSASDIQAVTRFRNVSTLLETLAAKGDSHVTQQPWSPDLQDLVEQEN